MSASNTTEAVVIDGPKAGFAVKTVKLGPLSDTELLVDIEACGICHTDLGIEQGYLPAPYPCIPGHEGGGTVVEVGSKVARVKPGDKVILSYTSCQACGACEAETPAACGKWNDMNFMRWRNSIVGDAPGVEVVGKEGEAGKVYGSFFGQSSLSRRSIVSEGSCVVVPQDTDLKLYAPLGCGLQTGAGAVLNRLKPEADSSIAIFGCGAVGMAAIMASAYLNVKTIIAVDVNDDRLGLAKSLGATHGFNGRSPTLIEDIRAVTKYNAGVMHAVEASGIPAVLKTAYEAVAPFGHLNSCGSPGPGVPVPIAVHENILVAKTYSGTLMGNGNPQKFIPFLIELQKAGKFPIEKLSKQYPLKDLDEAVHAMHDGSIIKPIIVMAL